MLDSLDVIKDECVIEREREERNRGKERRNKAR